MMRPATLLASLAGLLALTAALGSPIEDPPESPVEDLAVAERRAQRLMNAGLPFVEKMLGEHGEFFPFGAVMLPDGLIRLVGTFEGRERPFAEEVLDGLLTSLRKGAAEGEYQAAAVFVGVRVRNPVDEKIIDAVQVGLEHREGYCVDVFFPIRRGQLGKPFAGPRGGHVFPGCGG